MNTGTIEKGILGWIACNGFEGITPSSLVTPEAFSYPWAKTAYEVAWGLHQRRQVVDMVTIAAEIERLGIHEKMQLGEEWRTWSAHCDLMTPSANSAIDLLTRLKDARREEKIQAIGRELGNGEITLEEAQRQFDLLPSNGPDHRITLSSRRFSLQNPPPPARPVFKISGCTICTPGNLTALVAQAKAGKSATLGAFMAAVLSNRGDAFDIESDNPSGHAVIHFDSEQSPADHHSLVASAIRRAKASDAPSWLRSYRICDVPLSSRFELLEHELKSASKDHGGIHSVLIDGVADFVADPNNPEESFGAVERLHRLAVEYDTPIVCVLHYNPGSELGKTRGHLGSQLERKSETTLALKKDGDGVTTIFTQMARHAHLSENDGPRFQWSDEAGMHVSAGTKREAKANENEARLLAILGEVFTEPLRYSDAVPKIMEVADVKKRQAEVLFGQLSSGQYITKTLIGTWEVNQ